MIVARVMTNIVNGQARHFHFENKKSEFRVLLTAELIVMGFALTVLTQTNVVKSFETLTPGKEWSKYEGFNGAWYYEISVILQETLIINCFWANFIDLMYYGVYAYLQAKDRRFENNIKMVEDDDFDD